MKGLIKISKKYIGRIKGLDIVECLPSDLDFIYWDRPKSQADNYSTSFNLGFFGNFKEGNQKFTLPTANLACSIEAGIPSLSKKYLEEWTGKTINTNHIELNCNQGIADFKNKRVTTFIVDNQNRASMQDVNSVPSNTRICVSAAPCISDGKDVDFYRYVKLQGWGSDIFRSTYHNWLGIKGNKVYLISGKSQTSNMIYGMWLFNTLKDYKFEQVCLLDGGGSYYFRYDNKWISRTFEDRRINTIGVIR